MEKKDSTVTTEEDGGAGSCVYKQCNLKTKIASSTFQTNAIHDVGT
jgi:hypothetical protein